MEIVNRVPSELIPAEYNPRKISEKDFKQLKKSLSSFQCVEPIIVNQYEGRENVIVGGHQRLKAMIDLGWSDVPTIEVHLDLAEEKELNVRLNKNTGEFDFELLTDLFSIDELEDIGFDPDELPNIIEDMTEPLTDPDDVPEIPEIPKTILGDIYELGNHRLMCGDSTSIDAVEELMGGKKADITFTSPPYNANTKAGDGDIFNRKKGKKLYGDGYSDNLSSSDYVDFCKVVLENCFMFTEKFIFWNVSYNAKSRYEYIEQIQDRIGNLIEQICWKKSSTIPFKGSLMRDFEPIFLFSVKGESLGIDKVVSNHWEVSNTNSQAENHKACFPVELPKKAINLKDDFTIVLDPFGGSGTTMIACEELSVKARLMELDPKYCDVIVRRWEEFTGKKAKLLTKEVD